MNLNQTCKPRLTRPQKKEHFGLIDRSYPTDDTSPSTTTTTWSRFTHYIKTLSASLPATQSIKVLFLARHGQGWHNVAESKYGTKAWDCYYSFLNGSDGLTWADAHLTPLGQEQATSVHDLWAQEYKLHGIPAPQTYYVSPLTRTLQTADLSFRDLELPRTANPYKPFIKELLREALGMHTCDRRSTGTEILSAFPHAVLESGFSEQDRLWEPDYREPASARRYRLETFLDDVFAEDEGTFLSFTSHSGAIASLLQGVGHREFRLETGGVIPVVVRAERVQGERVVPPREPSEAPPMCDGPPEEEREGV